MKAYLLFIVLPFILFGCKSSDNKLTGLEMKKEISVLSDSSYLGMIYAIKYYNDQFYLSDSKNNRINVLDVNFNVSHIIGNGSGRGPGEFLLVNKITFHKDTIYALGSPNGISKFTLKGEFKGYIPRRTKGGAATNEFDIDSVGNIYTSSEMPGKHIVKIGLNGEELAFFGNEVYKKNGKIDGYGSMYHLLYYNKMIIAVRPYGLTVELFSLSGKHLKTIDFSKLDFLKSSFEKVSNENEKEKVYYEHIPNVSIYENKLLLQVRDFINNRTNRIIQFNITSNDIEFEKLYKFPAKKDEDEETFGPFVRYGKSFLIFEKSTAALRVYEIK